MKHTLLTILFFCCLYLPSIQAQSSQKIKRKFVKELNHILWSSSTLDWVHEEKMTIDSAFAINKEGILSVTVRYITDSSFFRVRMEAPAAKIKTILYDLYVILDYGDSLVTVYETIPGDTVFKETAKRNYFYTGIPKQYYPSELEQLQKLADKLRQQ